LYVVTGWFLLVVLVLLNLWLVVSGRTWVYRALVYNYVGIDDHDLFNQRSVAVGKAHPWPVSQQYNHIEPDKQALDKLQSLKSVAFLVIHRDSLLYEAYWDGYTDSSWTNSFSMSKSVVGALTGVALKQGYIRSIDQQVREFIPEYAGDSKGTLTIRQLLTMSAALSWDEAYASLFSVTTEAYYGRNLSGLMDGLQVVGKPGTDFLYQGGATQLLAMVIMRASGQNLSAFFSSQLWKPLGAEHEAGWSLDREQGMEKASCCIYSNARDFARIGSLYLHKGNWFGTQLIDSAYIIESLQAAPLQFQGKPNTEYGFQWWINTVDQHPVYYCRGILGQYIAIIPDHDLVVVRLGHLREQADDGTLLDLPIYLRAAMAMASKNKP
ncbi:MAG: serine hydrolase domain-containing protein, partial [Bacteroidota bacterium]